ncbi:MAG: OmpA family protein [Alphaproteobacteria bacterium]|nr:OmpA family protein [Alphaproteobacteria bacterium]
MKRAIFLLLAWATAARCDIIPIVFFEPGSAELGPKAIMMIREAVVAAPRAEHANVTGYCDPDEHAVAGLCPALARRRAEAVRAVLVARGVTARIKVRTSNELLDPCNPAGNRRVTIDLF